MTAIRPDRALPVITTVVLLLAAGCSSTSAGRIVHGGASMTLLDVVMAVAARSVAQEMGVVTIEMKTSFMQAARGALIAKGRLIHRTTTMAFTEASIFDAEGKICAHATGTFKYVKRLATGAKSDHPLNTISTD